MQHSISLEMLALADLAGRCAEETDRFFQRQRNDPRYCFELFRRAIVDGSQRAWDLVYAQYRPLVERWVQRHPAFPASSEEAQYLVNRTFEKAWTALTPGKFSHFMDLGALLRYVQMCVHSVLVDNVRVAGKTAVERLAELSNNQSPDNRPDVEEQILDRMHRQELWKEITVRLNDEKERQVVYASFVLALRPREICAHFPETFTDVRDVYRIKENVLTRLRRDAGLQNWIGENA